MCHGQAIGSQPVIGTFVCKFCDELVASGLLLVYRICGERTTTRACSGCAAKVRDVMEEREKDQ